MIHPRLLGLAIVLLSPLAAAGESAARGNEAEPIFAGDVPRTPGDLKAMERHVQKLYEKVRLATVRVGGGSGVIVTEDGYVLTAGHVAPVPNRDLRIVLSDGRSVRARTLGSDRGIDAGLLKIAEKGPWPYALMGKSNALKAGQWCLALGYPAGLKRGGRPVLRIGRVLASIPHVIRTDCPIMGGDSGGPIFDMQGNVIGISSRCDSRLTRNFHVPVDAYRNAWEKLVKGLAFNSRARGFLGITPYRGDEPADGAKIREVVDGSAAEKAGIKDGDVIVRFDGEEVKQFDDVRRMIREKKPGDAVEIIVRRGEKSLTFTVTLGERR
jgi:serine protease Do